MSAKQSMHAAAHARRRARLETATGIAWVSPWIIGFIAFLALPIGLSAYYSLTDYSLLEPPVWIGLSNYRELLSDGLWRRALLNTAVFAALAIPICTSISIALALLLNTQSRLAKFTRAVIFLPTLIPPVAVAIGWMWLLNTQDGLVNRALAGVGLLGPDWLGSSPWALTSILLITCWSVGGAVVIYSAALEDVPASLYEAARLDGAGDLRQILHISLPMISPAILFNVIVSIIGAMQVFALPLIMTRGGPDFSTYLYTQHVYYHGLVYGRMGYACASAMVQLLIIFSLTAVFASLARRFVFYRGG